MRNALLGIAAFVVLGAIGAAAFLWSGVYPIGATTQHSRIVYDLVEVMVRRAVEESADQVVAPARLDEEARIRAGLAVYEGWCLQCHGAPGVAPAPFATGMNPPPPPLVQTAREWTPEEVFWVVDNGIAMAGMPSFRFKLTPDEMWAVTAFVETLPTLSPAAYAALVARSDAQGEAARSGSPARGGGT
ncbi:cytochrome c [Salinarimonas sp.]|uniref:c-type cytochrome n=1 Tax=Salinarimonas sp. TaxID=2766526 RepID=UPI0032D93F57